jgi:hypothetical protein
MTRPLGPASLALLVLACKPSAPTTTPEPSESAPPELDEDDDEAPESSKRPPPVEQILKIEGNLPEAQVTQMVQDHLNEIRTCYDEAMQDPNEEHLKGAIVVRFTVPSSGAVASPEIELTEFEHAQTERCIAGVVDTFAFPKQKAESTVHLPFYMNNF